MDDLMRFFEEVLKFFKMPMTVYGFTFSFWDTQQLIDNMLQADYISDEEILRNRGELQPEVTGEISNRSKRRIRKNKIA